jgi:uncharacterized FlgJ-related protein
MGDWTSWSLSQKQVFVLKLIKEKIKRENQSITDEKTLIISGQLAPSLFLYYGINAML